MRDLGYLRGEEYRDCGDLRPWGRDDRWSLLIDEGSVFLVVPGTPWILRARSLMPSTAGRGTVLGGCGAACGLVLGLLLSAIVPDLASSVVVLVVVSTVVGWFLAAFAVRPLVTAMVRPHMGVPPDVPLTYEVKRPTGLPEEQRALIDLLDIVGTKFQKRVVTNQEFIDAVSLTIRAFKNRPDPAAFDTAWERLESLAVRD